jgi:hypothetical protein
MLIIALNQSLNEPLTQRTSADHGSGDLRRLQIPIRDYLASILPGLADLPVRRVAALTPTAWVARP